MGSLVHELQINANWVLRYRYLGCGGSGLSVWVSSQATQRTRDAARALADLLHRALSSQFERTIGEFSDGSAFRASPPVLPDPNTIIILVNGRPGQ